MFPHEHNYLTGETPLAIALDCQHFGYNRCNHRESCVGALLFLSSLAKEVVLARKKASGLRGWDEFVLSTPDRLPITI